MTISHLGLRVGNVQEMTEFYLAALKPLGYKKRMEPVQDVIGLGPSRFGGPPFWLASCPNESKADDKGAKLHIAFHASNRQQVRDFHAAALKVGATCNGPPGIRKQYFPTYYAAFVLDPEGRNVEALCMSPGFIAEPTQRNLLLLVIGTLGAALWAYSQNSI